MPLQHSLKPLTSQEEKDYRSRSISKKWYVFVYVGWVQLTNRSTVLSWQIKRVHAMGVLLKSLVNTILELNLERLFFRRGYFLTQRFQGSNRLQPDLAQSGVFHLFGNTCQGEDHKEYSNIHHY